MTFLAAISSVLAVACGPDTSSATYLDGSLLVTAAHAVSDGVCRVDGRLIPKTYSSRLDDVVYGEMSLPGVKAMPYSCEPMTPGEVYVMIGHARSVEGEVSDRYANIRSPALAHMRIVTGLADPGMSGGPVVSKDGVVFGVVSARNVQMGVTFVKELRDTPICKAA